MPLSPDEVGTTMEDCACFQNECKIAAGLKISPHLNIRTQTDRAA